MAILAPKIEPRSCDELLEDYKALVPYYTPEWRIKQKSAGDAVVNIFIHYLLTIYQRMNRLPEKHIIAFLDSIGVRLFPAQPAVVPVTFFLSEGAKEHVLIPARTQVAAGDVIFETEKNMLVAPSRLIKIYSAEPTEDTVIEAPPNIVSGEPTTGFETQLQYLAHQGDRDIYVQSAEGLTEGDFIRIGCPQGDNEFAIIAAIEETKITLTDKLQKGTSVFLGYPPIIVRGIGHIYSHRLAGAGIATIGQLLQYAGKEEKLAAILEGGGRTFPYYRELAENLLENARKQILDKDYEDRFYTAVAAGEATFLSQVCYQAGEPVTKITKLELFKGKNHQEHVIYLGDENIFNISSKTEFEIDFIAKDLEPLPPLQGQWQYWGHKTESGETDWFDFDIQVIHKPTHQSIVKLNGDEIAEHEIKGIKSRWIRFKSESTIPLNIEGINVGTGGWRIAPLPTEAVRGIEEVYSQRLAEANINTVEELYTYDGTLEDLTEIITGSRERSKEWAENILENTRKGLLDKEYEDMITDIGDTRARGVPPDKAYQQDIPLNLTVEGVNRSFTTPWYPFGKKPATFNTFYIAADEAFSKKRQQIRIEVVLTGKDGGNAGSMVNTDELTLSWEYWNGKGWTLLQGLQDGTDRFRNAGNNDITFTCPNDMSKVSVCGQEKRWIRIRIVHGDYGRERMDQDNNGNFIQTDDTNPPVITRLTIAYDPKKQTPANVLVLNNLDYRNYSQHVKQGKHFGCVESLPETNGTLYLGFNQKLEKGPISLYFSLDEQLGRAGKIPRIEWEYYSGINQWSKPQVIDETTGFTRSGQLQFVFTGDFEINRKFGIDAYWLRAVDAEGYYKEEACNERPLTIKGIYLNTTPTVQCETIKNETLGSSDGTAGLCYFLKKTQVIAGSEYIRINEIKALSKEEMAELREDSTVQTEEETDRNGNLTAFWVKWNPIDSLTASSGQQRYYEIDHVSGEIYFGDGTYGKIPPQGTDNVKADYRSGGGEKGNLAAAEIAELKTSLPYLEKAYNRMAAAGGSNTEAVERILERGPHQLKHRNRAITAEDFEMLTFQASDGIARVKCQPNLNNRRRFEPGWVTVIVVPRSTDEKPRMTLQLKRRIEEYLHQRAVNVPVTEDRILVTDPVYVEVSVTTVLAAIDMGEVPPIESKSMELLKEYLNPLTGGDRRTGWPFGKIPCFSDFYALLEKVSGVDYVEELSITLTITLTVTGEENVTEATTVILNPNTPTEFIMPSYALVCNGNHNIKAKGNR
jgi:hypothetical protein